MKRIFIRPFVLTILLAAFCAVPALAGDKKTELTFSGSYVNPVEGKTIWDFGVESLFGITHNGILVLGPAVNMSSDDALTRAGLALEVNIPGQSGGFFAGSAAQYFLKDQEGLDRTTTSVRAGFKVPLSKAGLLKVYLEKPISGRGHELADVSGVLAVVIKL